MNVNADELIKFAKTLEDTPITTLSGSSTFTVAVTEKGMNYTPSSTGKPRKQTYSYIKRICDQFSRTQSFRRGDYSFTAHAAYILALIDRYVKTEVEGEEFDISEVDLGAAVPYGEMDSNIVGLAKAINAIPGLYTVGSCGGHRNNTPNQLPWGQWEVILQLELSEDNSPLVEAWHNLEALAYAISKCFDSGTGDVYIKVWSAAPDLNGYGESISFTMKGKDVSPDELMNFLIRFFELNPDQLT